MLSALAVLRNALAELWDQAFLAIFCSLAWLACVMLIVPGPPATVALFYVAERIVARDHFLEARDFLRALGRYFGLGWRWGAVNLPVLVILLVDIRVLPRMLPASLAVPVQLLFYLGLAVWIIINWYALAFLFQQKEPGLAQALRNGAIMLLMHPLFSLVLVISTAVLLAISLVLVAISLLFGPMGLALIGSYAVADRLEFFRAARS